VGKLIFKLPDNNITDDAIPLKLVIPGKIKIKQRTALWLIFVIWIYFSYMMALFDGDPPINRIISTDTFIFFTLFLMAYYFSFDQYLVLEKDISGWIIETFVGNSVIRIRSLITRSEDISIEIKRFSKKIKFTAIIRVYSTDTFDNLITKFVTINQTIKSIVEDLDQLKIPIRRKSLKDRPTKLNN
jgi:hypothetical protein